MNGISSLSGLQDPAVCDLSLQALLVQLRRMRLGPTYYGTPAPGRLGSIYVFDNKRPSCPPCREHRHG